MSNAVSKQSQPAPVTPEDVEKAAEACGMNKAVVSKIPSWAVIGKYLAQNSPFLVQLGELQADLQDMDTTIAKCRYVFESDSGEFEDDFKLAAMKCLAGMADAKRKIHQARTFILVEMSKLQLAVEQTPQNQPPPIKIVQKQPNQ